MRAKYETDDYGRNRWPSTRYHTMVTVYGDDPRGELRGIVVGHGYSNVSVADAKMRADADAQERIEERNAYKRIIQEVETWTP